MAFMAFLNASSELDCLWRSIRSWPAKMAPNATANSVGGKIVMTKSWMNSVSLIPSHVLILR